MQTPGRPRTRVPARFAALMAEVARLESFDLVRLIETEPITTSFANQLREILIRSGRPVRAHRSASLVF